MSFDSSGTFNRLYGSVGWQDDATANVKIVADKHDLHDQELANGLTECLTRSGKGIPTVDIPWGGMKIVNLGNPSAPGDAATKGYVDKPDAQKSAKDLSGADLDGRLNFTAPSGVNGITWTYADVSWIARHSVTSKYSNRLAMNNSITPNTTGDPSGDVFFIDDAGRINNSGVLTSNLSYDGSTWRTISPGEGTYIAYSGGSVRFSSNDVATITNPYASTTLRDYFRFENVVGSPQLEIVKSASGKTNQILFYTGAELRWQIQGGDATAESGTAVGSNFVLTRYNNSGVPLGSSMHIDRNTNKVTFYGEVYSNSPITADSVFQSNDTTCILATKSSGNIYFRPNGYASSVEQVHIDNTGDLYMSSDYGVIWAGLGIKERAGSNGSYGDSTVNFNGTSTSMRVYHGTSDLGLITWQCDYRMKRDIQPLDSMWDKVKSLSPIKYMPKVFGPFWDDGAERWGFIAHELQEKLIQTAAEGEKDKENCVQSVNGLVLVAALTKALQEAMARIEILESKVTA